mmetsp:Transcript_13415/g.44195  ORF Transcript_13415/g.44195 Transcript_13415/m.44195 type:complete len:246 (-) Transcript_13415:1882-2619(-)
MRRSKTRALAGWTTSSSSSSELESDSSRISSSSAAASLLLSAGASLSLGKARFSLFGSSHDSCCSRLHSFVWPKRPTKSPSSVHSEMSVSSDDTTRSLRDSIKSIEAMPLRCARQNPTWMSDSETVNSSVRSSCDTSRTRMCPSPSPTNRNALFLSEKTALMACPRCAPRCVWRSTCCPPGPEPHRRSRPSPPHETRVACPSTIFDFASKNTSFSHERSYSLSHLWCSTCLLRPELVFHSTIWPL